MHGYKGLPPSKSNRCSGFIQCEVNADGMTGRPTVRQCPSGLGWNNKYKDCDFPATSTCDETKIHKNETKEAIPPPNRALSPSAVLTGERTGYIYANPASSQFYIHCTDRIAYIVKCQSGESMDAIKACENPEK
ncbi:hypothetical protein VI817_005411 [Penicillium citrinum]|nr:hypothetical protein VI817_005411 [Penicillium citrinum]